MAAGDPIKATDINTIQQSSSTKPLVRLVQQVVQSIPASSVQTALLFGAGSEDIDTDNFHDTATNTSRITPTVAGYYRLNGVYYTGSNAAALTACIAKNGTRVAAGSGEGAIAAGVARGIFAGPVILSANGSTDFFEIHVSQNTVSAVNTNVSVQFASILEAEFLRPL